MNTHRQREYAMYLLFGVITCYTVLFGIWGLLYGVLGFIMLFADVYYHQGEE